MELSVFLADLDHLENLNETMELIEAPEDKNNIFVCMNKNNSVNQESLWILKQYYIRHYNAEYFSQIERIYFGNETCEWLIPGLDDVQKALKICQKEDYQFTFVTPFITQKGLKKLIPVLEFLNKQENIEVVFNDYGMLHLIETQFTNLIPVIGRLLIKMKRDPRFSKCRFSAASIQNLNINNIIDNQTAALQLNSIDNPVYQEFLKGKGVTRLGIDTLPQGINLKELYRNSKPNLKFPIDIYWPWTYVTCSRSCFIRDTAAHSRYHVLTNEPCPLSCKDFECILESDKEMQETIIRGNTVWMNSIKLYEYYFNQNFKRLIYQPYIPI
ncbi:MAG: hypothetical protein JXB50_16570 [Spirochaetes bacterium]|nr:hypothetical protein [Spirochaetota bacterium]